MQVAQAKNIRAILSLMKSKNYRIFERPNELNIVGVRHNSNIPNKFDDLLYVFWKNAQNVWEGKYFTITTDPGTYYLLNPLSPLGAAILKAGQYINSHVMGLHQGKYEALVQRGNLTVIRDYDRNAILDFNNGREETGAGFGINIHRANKEGTTLTIDKNSAGCQVFESAADFDNFMALVKKHVDLYGNGFTYTLIDERAYIRLLKKNGIYIIGAIGVLLAVWVLYRTMNDKSIIPEL